MKLPLCCMINPIVFDDKVTTFGLCREHGASLGKFFGFANTATLREGRPMFVSYLKASVEVLGDSWKQ
jgi:hypothetical protein